MNESRDVQMRAARVIADPDTDSGAFPTTFSSACDAICLLDYGAMPNSGPSAATANTQAMAQACAYARSNGGGTIVIPPGMYMFNASQDLLTTASGFHNLIIQGSGGGSTILDYSLCPSESNGLNVVGWGGRIGFRGFTVQRAPNAGIDWNFNGQQGVTSVSRIFAEDVIVDGCGGHGMRFFQNYMGQFSSIESRNNGAAGFFLQDSFTSMSFDRCWAGGDAPNPNGGNTGVGWDVCGLTYCNFRACGSDWNAVGWRIRSSNSTVLTACGAESNGEEGFLVTSVGAEGAGGVRALVLDGCFAFNNGKQDNQSFANFLGVSTGNNIPISLETRACVDTNTDGAVYSRVFNGESGQIEFTDIGSSITLADVANGSVDLQNNSVAGRSIMVGLVSSIPIGPSVLSSVPFNSVVSNRLGATLSGGSVTIPRRVHRVRVTCGLYWDNNSQGARFLQISKNGQPVYGAIQEKGLAEGYTQQNGVSAVIEVSNGDAISTQVVQTSGTQIALIGNVGTYMSVEAVG